MGVWIVAGQEGYQPGPQLYSSPLTSGWSETSLANIQLLPSDSLVLECVYNTGQTQVSLLLLLLVLLLLLLLLLHILLQLSQGPVIGGVGRDFEHCMSVLTYTGADRRPT